MPLKHAKCDNPYIGKGRPCRETKCGTCQWYAIEPSCPFGGDTGIDADFEEPYPTQPGFMDEGAYSG